MMVSKPILALLSLRLCLCAEDDLSTLRKNLADLSKRSQLAGLYSWEGELSIAFQQDSGGPFLPGPQAKVQLALAADGKSLVKVQGEGFDEDYWVISNGKKTWSYLPGKKQYVEEESASSNQDDSDDDDTPEERGAEAPPIERFAWEAVPQIGKLLKNARSLNTAKTASLKLAEGKVTWPVIDIESKPDADGSVTVGQLVVAPDHATVGRLVWADVQKGSKIVRISILFNRFSLGEPLPDDLFTFDPPKKAKLVEELTIPGQNGSVLVNHESPSFEARTLSGEKVNLNDLRGKVVLLDFWASWCPPCREELPTIAKLYSAYKDKDVVVLGVDDEDKSTAKKYLEKAGLDLPTLDDGSQKAHRLYRISAIPTVYIIDAQGKVVKYLRGGRSEETLRAALKTAGAKD